MHTPIERLALPGPAGPLECAIQGPAPGTPARGVAVWCHPHPVHGGTMDNKVITTLARGFVQLGWKSVRFNFRGVGASAGQWDEGRGEVDDALAVIRALHEPGCALVLGGFSFGGYVATQAAARLREVGPGEAAGGAGAASAVGAQPATSLTPHGPAPTRLVLVAPAAGSFVLAPVPAHTLVIHGEVDDVIPLAAVLDWARPQALPITLVPGAGHFFHGQLPVLRHIVQAAFR